MKTLYLLVTVILVSVFISCSKEGVDATFLEQEESLKVLSEADRIALREDPSLLEKYLKRFQASLGISEETINEKFGCAYNCGVAYSNCMEGVYLLREGYYDCLFQGGTNCYQYADEWIEAFDQCMITQSACLNRCDSNSGGGSGGGGPF